MDRILQDALALVRPLNMFRVARARGFTKSPLSGDRGMVRQTASGHWQMLSISGCLPGAAMLFVLELAHFEQVDDAEIVADLLFADFDPDRCRDSDEELLRDIVRASAVLAFRRRRPRTEADVQET